MIVHLLLEGGAKLMQQQQLQAMEQSTSCKNGSAE
jgi:hypothetical protein